MNLTVSDRSTTTGLEFGGTHDFWNLVPVRKVQKAWIGVENLDRKSRLSDHELFNAFWREFEEI